MAAPGDAPPASGYRTDGRMMMTVQSIHPRDFIRATANGTLDRTTAERHLAALAGATAGLTDFDVILDTRGAELDVSTTDLWHLAVFFAGLPKMRRRKIAILPAPDAFDRAAFFAVAAENRGTPIRAFETFEEAIDWLVQDRTASVQ
jgi:hypothetical protein